MLAGLVLAPAHDVSGSEPVSEGEVREPVGEKEKNSPPVDSTGGHSQFGADSSLEAMSVSTSMSMPSLEDLSHTSIAADVLPLQDPALRRLVAEAFRLSREGVVEREHTLRPAQSLLRSIVTGLGGAGGGGGEGSRASASAAPQGGASASATPQQSSTSTPPSSTSTPVSGAGGGVPPPLTGTPSSPVSGTAGDTISTASK